MSRREAWSRPSDKADPLMGFIYAHLAADPRLTKEEFCKKVGIDKATLNYWFHGGRDPTLSKLRAAIGFFGYTLKPTPIFDMSKVAKKRTRRVPMEAEE